MAEVMVRDIRDIFFFNQSLILLPNEIQHDSLEFITFNKQDLKHHCELTS